MSRTAAQNRKHNGAAPPAHGVLRAALLLIAVLLLGANMRATITAVGPVLANIRQALGIGAATASALVSTPLVAFAVISPFAPALARRFGIERALALALAVLAIGTVVRSIPGGGAIWIGTALLGIAIATINVVLPALVKREYPERIGTITGWYIVSQSMLAAIAAGLAVPIAHTSAGWRASLGVWAGLALLALAAFVPQLRRRKTPAAATAGPVPGPSRRRSMWRSASAWQVLLFMGLQSTVFYVFITWWPSIEQSQGISPGTAGWHQFLFQMLNVLGGLLAGALIQRLRDQRALAAGYAALFFVATLGQLLLPQAVLLWVVLAGTSAGGSIVVALALFGLRTREHDEAAALSGMAQSGGYLLAAAGPVLFGLLHDASGAWTVPLLALLGITVAQFAFGILAGRAALIGAPRA